MFNWGHWSKAGAYYWAVDKLMPEFGVLGESPVPRVGEVGCADDFPGDECQSIYELAISSSYPRNDKAWAYFHLTPPDPQPVTPTIAKPAEPMLIKPVAPDLARAASCQPGAGYSDTACSAYTIELDTYTQQLASDSAALAAYSASMGAYEAAWSAYRDTEAAWAAATETRYTALDEAIVKYNEAIDGGRIKSWTQYEVTRTHSQSEVVSSDPAQILAGGAMRITGLDLLNDKSRILAGGLLSGDLGSLRNVDGEGVYITHEAGTSQTTWTKYKGDRKGYSVRRWSAPTPYLPADKVTTIALPVAETRGDTAPSGSGASIAGRSTSTLDTPVESTGTATAGTRAAAIIEVRANLAAPVAGSTGSAPVAAPQTAGSIATAEPAGAAPVALVAAPAAGASGLAGIKTAALPVAAAPALVPVDAAPAGVTPALQGSPTAARPQAVGAAPAVVIRSVAPDTRLPSSSLFTVNPAGDARYLVETDPRFTDRRQWLSSDYMLSALSVDPATVQKRLGDGFYEQRLVREQVAQLTGRRFLDGYADDEAQYLALLDNAATYARAWNLLPGLALSAEQMAGLTSDIVWLVDEAVTLPDGRLTHALVPRLYVRVREGDLDGNGSLISADALDIALSGDLQNNATLAGRSVVSLSAENVKNLGGRIRGTDVGIRAGQDLSIEGGRIEATDRLAVLAGRDLNIATTTRSTATAQGNYTGIDRIAGLYITGSTAAGELIAAAGRDLGLTAATVENAGQGSTVLSAGRDLNLATVTTTRRQETVWDASNYRKDANSLEIGTTLDVAGKLRLEAGQDIALRAASITSDQGALDVLAGRDIALSSGRETLFMAEAHRDTDRNIFGSETSISRQTLARDSSLSTTLSANTVRLQSGRDIVLTGSNVASTAGTALLAGRNIRIEADTDRLQESRYSETRQSGLISSSGIGVTIGSRMQSLDNGDVRTSTASSTVGSIEGNVLIEAGKTYSQIGSSVFAPRGDVGISASKVDILEARATGSKQTEMKFRQSGMTVAVTSPVISAIQSAEQLSRVVSRSGDARMHALAAASTALSAQNAYTAVQAGQGTKINGKDGQIATVKDADGNATSRDANAADKVGGINLSISIGTSAGQSKSLQKSDSAEGSTVMAGGNTQIAARGAVQDSTLTVQGSDIRAGNKLSLSADNAIRLQAAQNTAEQRSTNTSSSGSIGIGFALGGAQNGFTLQASASAARGNADGNDVSWRNSHIEAGNTLALKSGGNTTVRGAVAAGQQVSAEIGGNLALESLQDTSQYKSRQQSVGASMSLCIPPFCVGAGSTGSLSASQSKAMSNYASVTEQSGLHAGDKGFQVDVKGNTDLKGAVIASSEEAVQAGKNSLSTATLSTSDIKNYSEAKASSSGINLSSDMFSQGKYGGAKSIIGNALNNASGSERSSGRTLSAVSGGAVSINNDGQQQQLTGISAGDTLSSLNRDISNTHVSAARQDVTAMKEVVELDRAIKQEAVKILSTYSDEAYFSRFKKIPNFVKIECTEGANCIVDPEKIKRTPSTLQEAAASSSSETVLAVNGILNDEKRAAELAYQNAATLRNPETGLMDLKPTAIYLMHIEPANNVVSELMGVAYEKISNALSYDLANFLGYTNGAETYSRALAARGEEPIVSLGHSRGTLVQESAFTILANRPNENGKIYTNPSLTVQGVGGAANVNSYYKAAAIVQGPKGDRSKITSSYFSDDIVATSSLAGGNPGAWTLKGLWQVTTTEYSMHSCYGTGQKDCAQVQNPLSSGYQGTPEGNATLIQYRGGERVDAKSNELLP
ncbi:MAG: hemagglutinin repeat-containing protein [Zoogloea sp.]|nr:hemagglutinin repeat-containing protein [Zoogloea sp.]